LSENQDLVSFFGEILLFLVLEDQDLPFLVKPAVDQPVGVRKQHHVPALLWRDKAREVV